MNKVILGLLFFVIFSGTSFGSQASNSFVYTGLVVDASNSKPISRATVQIVDLGKSTLTNDQGRFKLVSDQSASIIKISHVSYLSVALDPTEEVSLDMGEIRLEPTVYELKTIRVYNREYDPAQQIIVEAIRRKEEILSRLKSYRNDAYMKVIVRDLSADDSVNIFAITESQTTSYWEYPDTYKEVLTARRISANLPEGVIVAIGELLNFNSNRIEIGQYQVISPTATDALEYYEYYMLDTITVDGRDVYAIEIEPKDQSDPLFAGTIHIVDSTYDVVTVDVSVSEGVHLPLFSDLRYYQRMALFSGEYWSPVEISFSGLISLEIPVPGIPSSLSFEYLASLHSFEFDYLHPEGTFDEYEFEVLESADDLDSASWQANQMIPLTEEEEAGYKRIDSVENRPRSVGKKMLGLVGGATALMLSGRNPEIFHFNRVEGTYFGLGGRSRRLLSNTNLWGSVGYSHELRDWQYQFGLTRQVWKKWKLRVGGEIKDKVATRPSLTTRSNYNATLLALVAKYDPHDYYLEKGFSAGVSFRPITHTRVGVTYRDYEQSSLSVNTDYSLKRRDRTPRVNPSITDGVLRSIEVYGRYDSRQLIRFKGIDGPSFERRYFVVTASMEQSHPDFAGSDFNFRRYQLKLHAETKLSRSSQTTINASAGYSQRSLPPQKYFAVDFGNGLMYSEQGFNTLSDSLFFGDRAASVYLTHDLGRGVFDMIPGINRLSLGLMVHGGLFWSDFDQDIVPNEYQLVARSAFSEFGFSLYNLTPFLSPLNFAAGVTWQGSNYDEADRYKIHIGFKL